MTTWEELRVLQANGHRFVYSIYDGESCACGWRPGGFRSVEGEWEAHRAEAILAISPEQTKEEG